MGTGDKTGPHGPNQAKWRSPQPLGYQVPPEEYLLPPTSLPRACKSAVNLT